MEEKQEQTLAQQRKKELFFSPTNGYDRLAEGEEKLRPTARAIKPFSTRAKPSGSAWTTPSPWPRPPVSGPWSGGGSGPGTRCTGTTRASPCCWPSSAGRAWTGGGDQGRPTSTPRLDLKQNPLYEDKELAYCKTHYYGGIKKYQWTTVPMALHGVVVRRTAPRSPCASARTPATPVHRGGPAAPSGGGPGQEDHGVHRLRRAAQPLCGQPPL